MSRPLIIGVVGGSGSGKTTVTRAIQQAMDVSAAFLDQDGYYKDLAHLTLEERKRQIGLAEERLSRVDALLVEVRSSLEVLEGQKVLVEQAVEKAGSLQSLLRQADAAVGDLREASRTSVRMRGNIVEFPQQGLHHDDDDDADDADDDEAVNAA